MQIACFQATSPSKVRQPVGLDTKMTFNIPWISFPCQGDEANTIVSHMAWQAALASEEMKDMYKSVVK